MLIKNTHFIGSNVKKFKSHQLHNTKIKKMSEGVYLSGSFFLTLTASADRRIQSPIKYADTGDYLNIYLTKSVGEQFTIWGSLFQYNIPITTLKVVLK